MNAKRSWIRLLVVGGLTGCVPATVSLTPQARRVLPLAADPGPACVNLGNVMGKGGGLDVAEQLESAQNDALNKAAERGATHLVTTTTAYGVTRYDYSAVLMGIAYKCPEGVASQAPPDVPPGNTPGETPGPKSFLSGCPALPGESLRERAVRCRDANRAPGNL